MSEQTSIEWTQSTWNPVTGCTKLSAGCDHCYAERFAERFRGVAGHPYEPGFDLTLRPERVDQPRIWRRPRLIFVNSMSDLFHEGVPRKYIGRVFDTMETADWHIFQVLTKLRWPLITHNWGGSFTIFHRTRSGRHGGRIAPSRAFADGRDAWLPGS